MAAFEISRVGDSTDRLGEGLLWDAEGGLLYWIDSLGCVLRRLDPRTGKREDFALDSFIGSLALRQAGGAVLALADGFHVFDFATKQATPAVRVALDGDDLRFNDGKVDRQGRFLAGTLHATPPADGNYRGGLYRLDPDLTLTLLEAHVGVANGPCFSPDGKTFYFADSPRRHIYAYDYDTATGAIANKRVFVDTTPFDSAPDGATVDAEGFLWSALIRAGKIARFAPDGTVDRVIDMPVRLPTNVAFGGPGLDILYVTSLSRSVNFTDDHPDAGGLFAIEGLGIRGLAEPRFAG